MSWKTFLVAKTLSFLASVTLISAGAILGFVVSTLVNGVNRSRQNIKNTPHEEASQSQVKTSQPSQTNWGDERHLKNSNQNYVGNFFTRVADDFNEKTQYLANKVHQHINGNESGQTNPHNDTHTHESSNINKGLDIQAAGVAIGGFFRNFISKAGKNLQDRVNESSNRINFDNRVTDRSKNGSESTSLNLRWATDNIQARSHRVNKSTRTNNQLFPLYTDIEDDELYTSSTSPNDSQSNQVSSDEDKYNSVSSQVESDTELVDYEGYNESDSTNVSTTEENLSSDEFSNIDTPNQSDYNSSNELDYITNPGSGYESSETLREI
ncbi:hypothetical protein WICMUC_004256 [Wickerhamomyces mucosus]|uniref:Uncharacterized protein n=1 Tax=Wickerhamomyces mucosus TaxID=1378264 RepID=A0A9P8PIT9_9ASCO|nr:hypothetical protein WICMUC_004256 [Wickerhamomyces mucosus]